MPTGLTMPTGLAGAGHSSPADGNALSRHSAGALFVVELIVVVPVNDNPCAAGSTICPGNAMAADTAAALDTAISMDGTSVATARQQESCANTNNCDHQYLTHNYLLKLILTARHAHVVSNHWLLPNRGCHGSA